MKPGKKDPVAGGRSAKPKISPSMAEIPAKTGPKKIPAKESDTKEKLTRKNCKSIGLITLVKSMFKAINRPVSTINLVLFKKTPPLFITSVVKPKMAYLKKALKRLCLIFTARYLK